MRVPAVSIDEGVTSGESTRVDDGDTTDPAGKDRPADAQRLRELADALGREREARERAENANDETRKMIHALNNVLCIVTAHAAILAEDVAAGDPLRESVEEIVRASGKAGELTRKLADLQRRARKGEPGGQGRA